MSQSRNPTLEPRDADAFCQEILSRGKGFNPDWAPTNATDRPGVAVLESYCRYLEIIAERLNEAPNKNRLAFYNHLAIELTGARAARAPVQFVPVEGAVDGRILARTRLGASSPDSNDPVVFETDQAIALASARLKSVIAVWPEQDEYSDHTAMVLQERPFTVDSERRPLPHEFYLAHDRLLALVPGAVVEVRLQFAEVATRPLKIAWEYHDGTRWRAFESGRTGRWDGTAGFSRSGTVSLSGICGDAQSFVVNGLQHYWIRARLAEPLPTDSGFELPVLAHASIQVRMSRPLVSGPLDERTTSTSLTVGCVGELVPDQLVSEGSTLDLSRAFKPLGSHPEVGSVFYFSNEEILAKPGARAQICYRTSVTRQEEAYQHANMLEKNVKDVRDQLIDAVKKAVDSAITAASSYTTEGSVGPASSALSAAAAPIISGTPSSNPLATLYGTFTAIATAAAALHTAMDGLSSTYDPPLTTTTSPQGVTRDRAIEIGDFRQALGECERSSAYLTQLSGLRATSIVLDSIESSTALSAPVLVWEYWNGSEWLALSGDINDAANLTQDQHTASFVVPADARPSEIEGTESTWLRARLLSGGYDLVYLVSWWDTEGEFLSVLPVVENTPPTLEAFYLGYDYQSEITGAELSFSFNDFRYEFQGENSQSPFAPFEPFAPSEVRAPSLYLGFDRPLPADLTSVYWDFVRTEVGGGQLRWQSTSRRGWLDLQVRDDTDTLRRPGLIQFLPSDTPNDRPTAEVAANGHRSIDVATIEAAKGFHRGDYVEIAGDEVQVTRRVRSVEGATITVEAPVPESVVGAKISQVGTPLFGTTNEWIRAVQVDVPILSWIQLNAIHMNTVWATNARTYDNELIGSADGRSDRRYVLRQTPVMPGEVVEVRELEGARAANEYTRIREELIEQGRDASDVRLVFDRRTGAVKEAWVRWHSRTMAQLSFSTGDERHYFLERTSGQLIFGCRLPPPGATIVVRRYRSGGGDAGNVGVGEISQLLGAAAGVESVRNVVAAAGGAAPASESDFVRFARERTRHWGAAISTADYEALAREATSAVIAAKARSATIPNGLPRAGHVTLSIVPKSDDALPLPTRELRRLVKRFILKRTPASVSCDQLHIVDPVYCPVDVVVRFTPVNVEEARATKTRIESRLARFLHPGRGGRLGSGWHFGEDVFSADVAATVEEIDGVDFVVDIQLQSEGVPQGEIMTIPAGAIVAAGAIIIDCQLARQQSCLAR